MELDTHLQQAYKLLYKKCLYQLSHFPLPELSSCYLPTEYILIKVCCKDNLVFQNNSQLLSYLFNSLGSLCMTLAYIVQVESDSLHSYFVLQHPTKVPLAVDLFLQSIEDLFPGISLHKVTDSPSIISEFFYLHATCPSVSACSLVPNPSTSKTLLGQLVSLMPRDNYTFMLLAETIPAPCYLGLKKCISQLHLNLSTFREITYSINTSATSSDSNTHSKTCTQNDSASLSKSNTNTHTENTSRTHSSNLSFSNKINDKTNLSYTQTDTCNTSENETLTEASSNTSSNQNTASDADNHVKTCTTVESTTKTSRSLNLEVVYIMEQLELFLKRHHETESLTMFNFCTYFFSPYTSTNIRASYNYTGLGSSPTLPFSLQFINSWTADSPYFKYVLDYLKCFRHPIFYDPLNCEYITPALPTSSLEYATLLDLCLNPSS